MLPPLVKLATSAAPGERKYICFAGAGLSKDAGLPTAWDLMLATAAMLRAAEPVDESKDLQSWFLESQYARLSYAELIGGLFSTAVEQQRFMREKLHADKPGKAHQLIAELAVRGVIRCVITTNFDDLIEKALLAVGLPVQVIANDDDLKHSEPLIHCKQFRVYKPHGTLGVGHLRNTPADLERLSPRVQNELVRVMRDHGLMILGYSGADPSILKAFERRKQSHYPTFWINPSPPGEHIPPLFGSETYTYVPCRGASVFISDLLEMYKRLVALAPQPGLPAEVSALQEALRVGSPTVGGLVRAFMDNLVNELRSIAPVYGQGGEFDELIVQALDKTNGLYLEFARVVRAIAENAASSAAMALYKEFGRIVENYYPHQNIGSFNSSQFDFWKFVGHELFVMFVASLMREDRLELLGELLQETIFIANNENYEAGVIGYEKISQYVVSLDDIRNQRLGRRRISLHADMINTRHTENDMAEISPISDFTSADFFLYMHSEAQQIDAIENDNKVYNIHINWVPRSVLYLRRTGMRFMLEATSAKFAERLIKVFGVPSIAELKVLVENTPGRLSSLYYQSGGFWTPPLSGFRADKIASM